MTNKSFVSSESNTSESCSHSNSDSCSHSDSDSCSRSDSGSCSSDSYSSGSCSDSYSHSNSESGDSCTFRPTDASGKGSCSDSESSDSGSVDILNKKELYGMPKKVISKLYHQQKELLLKLSKRKDIDSKMKKKMFILERNLENIKKVTF